MKDVMNFNDIAISALLWRRNQDARADMGAAYPRRRLDVLGDIGGLARKKHHVEFVDIDTVRDSRRRYDTAQGVTHLFHPERRSCRRHRRSFSDDRSDQAGVDGGGGKKWGLSQRCSSLPHTEA